MEHGKNMKTYIWLVQSRSKESNEWNNEAWSPSRKKAEKYKLECEKQTPEVKWRVKLQKQSI